MIPGLPSFTPSQQIDIFDKKEQSNQQAAIAEKKRKEPKVIVKAPGRLVELMMPIDKPLANFHNLSSVINKKVEQKRTYGATERSELSFRDGKETKSQGLVLPNIESNFNTDLLRNRFATEIPATEKRPVGNPPLKPSRSEATLLSNKMSKYLLDGSSALDLRQKVLTVRPRDRNLKTRPKLEPLASSIFESR